MQISAYTPSAAAGSGLEHDVARTGQAPGIPAAHRSSPEPAEAGAPHDAEASVATPLAYTASGRIREGSVRPRISIVV